MLETVRKWYEFHKLKIQSIFESSIEKKNKISYDTIFLWNFVNLPSRKRIVIWNAIQPIQTKLCTYKVTARSSLFHKSIGRSTFYYSNCIEQSKTQKWTSKKRDEKICEQRNKELKQKKKKATLELTYKSTQRSILCSNCVERNVVKKNGSKKGAKKRVQKRSQTCVHYGTQENSRSGLESTRIELMSRSLRTFRNQFRALTAADQYSWSERGTPRQRQSSISRQVIYTHTYIYIKYKNT